MSIFDEAQQLEELTVIAKSLVRYATALEPGIVFERQRDWWLATPEHNFVGFRFRWSGQVAIDLSLCGEPGEQFTQTDLVIKRARFGYSRCTVTHADQLMPASVCIWRAHRLFHRERHIETGALRLLDDAENERGDWLRPRPRETKRNHQAGATPSETSQWYDEVRDFMKKNRIVDSSIIAD